MVKLPYVRISYIYNIPYSFNDCQLMVHPTRNQLEACLIDLIRFQSRQQMTDSGL